MAGSKIAPIVGRLLVIGFEGTEMTAGLRNLLARAQPAGVILFARNVVRAEQTCELLRECRGNQLFDRDMPTRSRLLGLAEYVVR